MSGYCGKIECGTRHLGKLSLPMLLAALDADLYLAPRSDAVPAETRIGSAGQVDRTLHRAALNSGEPNHG